MRQHLIGGRARAGAHPKPAPCPACGGTGSRFGRVAIPNVSAWGELVGTGKIETDANVGYGTGACPDCRGSGLETSEATAPSTT